MITYFDLYISSTHTLFNFHLLQLLAAMEVFSLSEIVGTETLAELKCVLMALGEPSVMTFGTTVMPVWYAGNLDTPHMVR